MAKNLKVARASTSQHDDATDVRDTLAGDTLVDDTIDIAAIDLRRRPREIVAAGRTEAATRASRFVVDWAPPEH